MQILHIDEQIVTLTEAEVIECLTTQRHVALTGTGDYEIKSLQATVETKRDEVDGRLRDFRVYKLKYVATPKKED